MHTEPSDSKIRIPYLITVCFLCSIHRYPDRRSDHHFYFISFHLWRARRYEEMDRSPRQVERPPRVAPHNSIVRGDPGEPVIARYDKYINDRSDVMGLGFRLGLSGLGLGLGCGSAFRLQ